MTSEVDTSDRLSARSCASRAVARGAGARLRHLHALLQGDRGRGLRQAARRVVSALHSRQGLRHLRDAADRLPHLLLRVDADERTGRRMEARAREVRAGDGRGRSSHRVRRSGISRRVAQRALSTLRSKARAPAASGSSRSASARKVIVVLPDREIDVGHVGPDKSVQLVPGPDGAHRGAQGPARAGLRPWRGHLSR